MVPSQTIIVSAAAVALAVAYSPDWELQNYI